MASWIKSVFGGGGDITDLLFPAAAFLGASDKLKIIDNNQADVMFGFRLPGPGADFTNWQGAAFVNKNICICKHSCGHG